MSRERLRVALRGREGTYIPLVDVGTGLQEPLHAIEMAFHCRHLQRSIAFLLHHHRQGVSERSCAQQATLAHVCVVDASALRQQLCQRSHIALSSSR